MTYSGLKTAVVNYLHTLEQRGEKVNINDVCASFQKTAVDMLVDVAVDEIEKSGLEKVVLAGGVAANSYLRERLTQEGEKRNLKTYFPPMSLCTDNAAMVARRALDMVRENLPPADLDLNAVSYLKISDCYKH